MPTTPREVRAAGAVTFRSGGEVLLVHRPKYDDWSFPKGKIDRGEHRVAAAVREVHEETGLVVRLGPALPDQHYAVRGGSKTVHYWVARVVGGDDVGSYVVNSEIDDVRWVPREEARSLLSYEADRETLARAERLRKPTHPVVVLRHAKARDRRTWRRDDRERPLLKVGLEQARRLVPVLAAFAPEEVVTSTSTRCVQTVQPFVAATGTPLRSRRRLSEEDATAEKVVALVDRLLDRDESLVLCTHRPVLPTVFDALGVDDPGLEPGGLLVVHRRKGRVVAVEQHGVR